MAAAYAYAEGGPILDELVLARTVDKYGVQAVFGRSTLSFHEIRMMTLAENIVNAYQARKQSKNWAEWADANPGMAEILGVAGRLFEELDNG